jgi:hypothetical protein
MVGCSTEHAHRLCPLDLNNSSDRYLCFRRLRVPFPRAFRVNLH